MTEREGHEPRSFDWGLKPQLPNAEPISADPIEPVELRDLPVAEPEPFRPEAFAAEVLEPDGLPFEPSADEADALAAAATAAGLAFAQVPESFATTELPEFAPQAIVPPHISDTAAQRVPAGAAGFAGVGDAPASKPVSNGSLLWWIAGGLVALLVIVGLYYFGTQISRLVSGGASAPTATATPLPTEAAAPGTWAWDQLAGGECLDPYTDAWQQEYTVVDCAAPHAAQMVYRGTFASDGATVAFPGEAELGAQINTLCTQPGVFDTKAASAYSDLRVQGAYPVTADQWDSGQNAYYCFVSRADGAPLTGSLAGPGPQ